MSCSSPQQTTPLIRYGHIRLVPPAQVVVVIEGVVKPEDREIFGCLKMPEMDTPLRKPRPTMAILSLS